MSGTSNLPCAKGYRRRRQNVGSGSAMAGRVCSSFADSKVSSTDSTVSVGSGWSRGAVGAVTMPKSVTSTPYAGW